MQYLLIKIKRIILILASLIVVNTLLNATTYFSKGNLDPSLTASWSLNPDGTGAKPTNFITNGDVFIIQSTHAMELVDGHNWKIGGGTILTAVTLQVDGKLTVDKNTILTISSYSTFLVTSNNTVIIVNNGNSKFVLETNSTLSTYNTTGIIGDGGIFPNNRIPDLPTATGGTINVVFNGDAPISTEGLSNVAINVVLNGDAPIPTEGLGTNVSDLNINNPDKESFISSNITVNTLSIYPGSKLTQTAGTITATNFNILSDATNGTATFVSNGTVNSTNSNVQQYIKGGRNWYVSSPVNNAVATGLTTGTTKASSVFYYSEPSLTWVTTSSTLNPGIGYVAANPNTEGVVNFSGAKLNTGAVTVNLTRQSYGPGYGFNLVGNPYPSYTDWMGLTKTNLLKTIWYRTKDNKTPSNYVFDTFNENGLLGTNNNGIAPVTNWIPPMQAFWVRVDPLFNTGSLIFQNANRAHQDVSTNKLRVKAEANSGPKVLRLEVTNGINSDETIVYFNSAATNEFDDYDSPKMSNNNLKIPEIYTMAGGEQLVINGLNSVPFDEEIPLGFYTREENAFSIKATQLKNFDENVKLYLKDKALGIEQLLDLDNDYTFSSDIYSSTDRFSLIFKSISLTTELSDVVDNSISIVKVNNCIVVNCDSEPKGVISVYNALGQFITSKSIQLKQTKIDMEGYSGVCFVKISTSTKNNNRKLLF